MTPPTNIDCGLPAWNFSHPETDGPDMVTFWIAREMLFVFVLDELTTPEVFVTSIDVTFQCGDVSSVVQIILNLPGLAII